MTVPFARLTVWTILDMGPPALAGWTYADVLECSNNGK